MVSVWMLSEDNLEWGSLFAMCVDPGDQTWAVSLGGKHLYLLSYLVSLAIPHPF